MLRFSAALIAAATLVSSAPAFDLGLGLLKKKPKGDSQDKVKQLVGTLQTDPDEKKRLAALGELREYDTRHHPELVPSLIASLQKDPSPTVRSSAADTIGKTKPVYQQAGLALESSQAEDPAKEVREAAKAALFQYHLNGYRPPAVGGKFIGQTSEPPLAAPKPPVAIVPTTPNPTNVASSGETVFRPITNAVGKGTVHMQTAEPPLAKPKPTPVSPPASVPELPIPSPRDSIAIPPMPTISVPPPLGK